VHAILLHDLLVIIIMHYEIFRSSCNYGISYVIPRAKSRRLRSSELRYYYGHIIIRPAGCLLSYYYNTIHDDSFLAIVGIIIVLKKRKQKASKSEKYSLIIIVSRVPIIIEKIVIIGWLVIHHYSTNNIARWTGQLQLATNNRRIAGNNLSQQSLVVAC
jgi:hypothetical protein